MRKTTPARRKGAVKVILFGVLAAAVILLAGALGRRSADTAIRAGTNEERIAYLRSLGWEVEPTPILEQEITMPKDFPDVLKQYNELQRQQGFDLEEYAGKKLTLYTYRITNHPDAEEADRLALCVPVGTGRRRRAFHVFHRVYDGAALKLQDVQMA